MPKLNQEEILTMLPHRHPFLMVNAVDDYDLEVGTIVARKNVLASEEFFQGHFPEAPIMPGVLIVEALAQTSGLLANLKGFNSKIAVLLNVNNAKFRNGVHPGDILILKSKVKNLSSKGGKFECVAEVHGKVAAQAEIGFVFVEKESI